MKFRCWGWFVLIAAVVAACGGGTSGHLGSDASVDGPVDGSVDGPQEPVCGDGVLATGETCDDGNVVDGDGCNATCTVATCFVPVTHPTIAAALLDASCTTITVYSGTYAENLVVDHAVTIRGVGAAPVIIDGSQAGSVITSTAPLVLETVTVQNGRAARGGGIESTAALTLHSVLVEQNVAHGALEAYGGGIDSSGGALVIENSTVSHNSAVIEDATTTGTRTLSGGGLNFYGVDAQITGGTFASNSLQGHGPTLIARGGGIAVAGISSPDTDGDPDPTEDADFILTGVDVASNTIDLGADGTARGGGVWAAGTAAWWGASSTFAATSVHVEHNVVQADAAAGGGVMVEPRSISIGNALAATMTDSVIENNSLTSRTGAGGGIELEPTQGPPQAEWSGTLSLVRTHVDGNTIDATDAKGGGIALPMAHYNMDEHPTVNLSLLQSTVAGNRATGVTSLGGGIYQDCHQCGSLLDVRETTVSGNSAIATGLAADGGVGIYEVRAQVVNSTISGNQAQSNTKARGGGVGIHSQWLAYLDLASSTITNNVAMAPDAGGDGLYVYGQFYYASSPDEPRSALYLSLANTILDSCFGEIDVPMYFDYEPTSKGYNLFGTAPTSCQITAATGDQTAAPQLVPLGSNGGPTQTHALMPSSPALDAGDPAGCSFGGTALATDQRGMPRVNNSRCDIGAVEM